MASSQLQLPEVFEISNSPMSILEMTKESLTEVPQCYVRSYEEPELSSDLSDKLTEIPTIDMIKLATGSEASDSELENLHSSCEEWGIFQLVNHGVRPILLEKLNYEVEEFFKLPLEEKMKYQVRPGDVEGYGSIVQNKDQKRDWGNRFYMTMNPIHRRKPYLFPELPSSLRTTFESYYLELKQLALELLRFLGKAVKIDTEEIEELFEDGMQSARINYYPACPQPELVIGLTPHSDASGITILHQLNGVGGLQIKKDGVWVPVNFFESAFVVNAGDIFEILSNGKYKSTEHRVMVNSEQERISIAMFFNPKFEAEIGPSNSLITPENPPLFKRIEMEQYVEDFYNRRKLDGKSYLEQMKLHNGN
ncbi:protein SRG1-like [Argentina anserina]|uniref:protein SRG1-like n=1 Tax=Argentina anserina TaxID=57926 RepID=UPI0021768F48|nr:protein SRG1-like [Potentilla anserina]